MAIYDDLKASISGGFYTILEAQSVLNSFRKQLQITDAEYNELMELSKTLDPNTSSDEEAIWRTQMEKNVIDLKDRIDAIEKALKDGNITVTDPDKAKGTADDPIVAYRGAHYEKDKYYSDPEKDNEIYLCTTTVDLNGMPHDFVNIYFNWYSKAPETATTLPA